MDADRQKKVTDTLEKILSSKEFKEPKNEMSILERVGDMIRDIIEWLLDLLPDINPGSSGNFNAPNMSPSIFALKIFAVVLIIAFVLLLVFFIFRNLHLSKSIKQKEDAELLSVLKDSESVEQSAVEFYTKGDIRQAIRFLYMALLLRLNESNVVRIDKSKTNKQYLREALENQYPFYSEMQEFTHDFNRYWYGKSSVDRTKFEYWHSIYTSRFREVGK
jgi:uncharacterized membrane protein